MSFTKVYIDTNRRPIVAKELHISEGNNKCYVLGDAYGKMDTPTAKVLPNTLEEAKSVATYWTKVRINKLKEREGSPNVACLFPGMKTPTIVHESQLL